MSSANDSHAMATDVASPAISRLGLNDWFRLPILATDTQIVAMAIASGDSQALAQTLGNSTIPMAGMHPGETRNVAEVCGGAGLICAQDSINTAREIQRPGPLVA